jgi:hypothetical protein
VVLGPGPLVENLFRSLPMNLPPPPTIRITDEADVAFHLAERRMWHEGLEFGIPLKKSGQRLDVRSQGSVGLDDRSLDLKLSLPIPADLPQDRPLVAALAGKQVSLGVEGRTPAGALPVSYPHLLDDVGRGESILLADGAVELEVREVASDRLVCTVVNGGTYYVFNGLYYQPVMVGGVTQYRTVQF